MGNKVVKKEEAVKEVAFIEFVPAYEVVLKAGSQIEQGQALSLDVATGKYVKFVAGSTALPKTVYKGIDTLNNNTDTEIQVYRSADLDGNLVLGITKKDYDAIDNLEKYGIYIKF